MAHETYLRARFEPLLDVGRPLSSRRSTAPPAITPDSVNNGVDQ